MLAKEAPDEEEVKRVFRRLSLKVLNVHQRHAIFCLVNKLVRKRNREYMCRVWNRGDSMCDYNPDVTGEFAGVEQSVAHLYQTCGRVSCIRPSPDLEVNKNTTKSSSCECFDNILMSLRTGSHWAAGVGSVLKKALQVLIKDSGYTAVAGSLSTLPLCNH